MARLKNLAKYFPWTRWNLLTQFSVLSFFVLAGIALALAYGLEQVIIRNALTQQAYTAAAQVDLVITPMLHYVDLNAPLPPDRYDMLDQRIKDRIINQHLVHVKIWNTQGLLMYSDERDLVGKAFPISAELSEALRGETAMDLSSLDKAENVAERSDFTQLLEAYVPIRSKDNTTVVAAYEIYHDLSLVEAELNDTRRSLVLGIGAGFVILYISLFAIVRGASRELVRRHREIARRAEQMRVVNEVGRQLTSIRELDPLLAQVVQLVRRSFGYDRVTVSLVNGDVMRAQAAIGFGKSIQENLARLPALRVGEEGIIGRAALSPTPILVNDVWRDPRFAPYGKLDPTRSELAVPMRVQDKPIGVLDIQANWINAFDESDVILLESLAAQAAIAIENARLFGRTQQQSETLIALVKELESSYDATLSALSEALDARDHETEGHSQRVAALTCAIARDLGIADAEELARIERGALLHDIGKIGIADRILLKPGPLTDDEWLEMRLHPELGAKIVEGVDFLRDSVPIILYHQERFDGSGYPHGLRGAEIPLSARIFAIADVYDALTSDRPYRRAQSHEVAVHEIETRTGIWFDPLVVAAFMKLMHAQEMESPLAA